MALSSQAYWQIRSLKDYAKVINKTEKYIHSEIINTYQEASEDITNDIEEFYKKYADKNDMTLQMAKKRLSTVELKKINFDELIEMAKNDDEAKAALEAARLKSRITRLELLQLQVDARVAKLYDDVQISIYDYLYQNYDDAYYKIMYYNDSVYGLDFVLLPTKAIDNAILQNWSGKNFSETIWGHRQKLSLELKNNIETGLIKGEGVDKVSRRMSRRMKVKFSDAKRLVRTESNNVFNKGTLDGYIQAGISEEYQYLATLDNRTSVQCIKLDGKVFLLIKAETGVNLPPMHPNCRSTIVIYLGKDLSKKTRRAKADGSSYLVSADTDYRAWRKSLTDKQNEAMDLNLKITRNEGTDKKQYQNYKKLLGNRAPSNFAEFQNLKYNDNINYDYLKKTASEQRKIDRFIDKTNNNEVNYNVRKQKQQEHILGSEKWKKRVVKDLNDKGLAPGAFYKNIDIQELVDNYTLKGKITFEKNALYPREYVNADNYVGIYYDENLRTYKPTHRFAIIYSGKGTHAYPIKPLKEE